MFQVENYDGYANNPTLKFSGSDGIFGNLRAKQKDLLYKTFHKDGENSSILAYNLPDLVGFFAISEDKNGYGGAGFDMTLDGKRTVIHGPWSSREGCFNTRDGSIAIVSCSVGYVQYNFKLSYILSLIKKTNANIGFFKTTQFDDDEVYYVPCVDEPGRFTRTLVKLTKGWSVNRVEHYIKPDGTISPICIPLPAKM